MIVYFTNAFQFSDYPLSFALSSKHRLFKLRFPMTWLRVRHASLASLYLQKIYVRKEH